MVDCFAHATGLRIDQKQRRLRIVDRNHGTAVRRNRDAGERPRRLDLAEQFAVRQVDNRDGGVFLVLGIEALAARRDDQPMAVGRAGIDCAHDLVGLAINYRHHRRVLASDVNKPVRPELERMRRDIGAQIDRGDMGALVQIEDAEVMLRIRIAAVNAVAEDGHIGEAGFRHHEQLMHGAREAIDHDFRRKVLRIEEQDFGADLIDGNHAFYFAS